MTETCKCGKNKIKTETDGRFAYQVCDSCNDIINIIYLGEKEKQETYDESLVGL